MFVCHRPAFKIVVSGLWKRVVLWEVTVISGEKYCLHLQGWPIFISIVFLPKVFTLRVHFVFFCAVCGMWIKLPAHIYIKSVTWDLHHKLLRLCTYFWFISILHNPYITKRWNWTLSTVSERSRTHHKIHILSRSWPITSTYFRG
jgi:hypothetical protein